MKKQDINSTFLNSLEKITQNKFWSTTNLRNICDSINNHLVLGIYLKGLDKLNESVKIFVHEVIPILFVMEHLESIANNKLSVNLYKPKNKEQKEYDAELKHSSSDDEKIIIECTRALGGKENGSKEAEFRNRLRKDGTASHPKHFYHSVRDSYA